MKNDKVNVAHCVHKVFSNGGIGILSRIELEKLKDYFLIFTPELESGGLVDTKPEWIYSFRTKLLYSLREVCKDNGRFIKEATDVLGAYAKKLSGAIETIVVSSYSERHTYLSIFSEFDLKAPSIEVKRGFCGRSYREKKTDAARLYNKKK